MARFIARQPIRYNGERHESGAELDMAPKQAAQQVAAGVLAPAKQPAATKPETKGAE